MTPEEQQHAIERALHAWLDKKFTQFGKWSFGAIVAAFFFAAIWFILTMNGWHYTNDLGVAK
jgi:hypothetical protein